MADADVDMSGKCSADAPELVIDAIYAKDGVVIIEGHKGNDHKMTELLLDDALDRAKALKEAIPHMKYASDRKKRLRYLDLIINAIREAERQLGFMMQKGMTPDDIMRKFQAPKTPKTFDMKLEGKKKNDSQLVIPPSQTSKTPSLILPPGLK